MLVSASAVSISGPGSQNDRSRPGEDLLCLGIVHKGPAGDDHSLFQLLKDRGCVISSAVIRQAISFLTGMTGTSEPQAREDRIDERRGDAPADHARPFRDPGEFCEQVRLVADRERRADLRVPERRAGYLHGELFAQVRDHVPERFHALDLLLPHDRPVAEDEPLVGIVGKPHQDQALCPPVLEPPAGLLQHLPVIHAREDDGCRIDIRLHRRAVRGSRARPPGSGRACTSSGVSGRWQRP